MTIEEIKSELKTEKYSFLKINPYLGKNIILLTLGGSYAYGTNIESSDINIRGIARNNEREILLGNMAQYVVDTNTDTTIYMFNKMVKSLANCNPNTIEILGCKPEHYFYLSNIGKELLDNRKMFLSRKCIHSFGGYAHSQLMGMKHKAARLADQTDNEEYILKSIQNAENDFKEKYFPTDDGEVKLYIDKSMQEKYGTEIYMDISLKHYPLRDWVGMWNEMKSITTNYAKYSKRNRIASEKSKLGKCMMYLLRLYMMVIDILEKEEIITYRENEHDLLMDVRNGKYLTSDRKPLPEFYDIVNEYDKRFNYAKKNTSLPKSPDYKFIEDFTFDINKKIVEGKCKI